MKLHLYRISQIDNEGYDTYDSAVVCAPDEETARCMNPHTGEIMTSPEEWESGLCSSVWCKSPEHVRINYLGKADNSLKQGVIVASFNAG